MEKNKRCDLKNQEKLSSRVLAPLMIGIYLVINNSYTVHWPFISIYMYMYASKFLKLWYMPDIFRGS